MNSAVIGFPRIGKNRELKFATEKYFRKEISKEELINTAKEIRKENLLCQKATEIDYIPVNDFSFYDNFLDLAFSFNIIPERYKKLSLNKMDTYFAMARGFEDETRSVKALAMKKWFNTNYHYIVAEIEDDTCISLDSEKYLEEIRFANSLGITPKFNLIGPYTFFKLVRFTGEKGLESFYEPVLKAYLDLIEELKSQDISYLSLEEPALVADLTSEDKDLFEIIYTRLLANKDKLKVLLQTYFGDVRDIYVDLLKYDFDAYGLDFVEGVKTFDYVKNYGFPKNKTLFAGIVNGKNIWKNNYKTSLELIANLKTITEAKIVINTSCSMLHVPLTLESETDLAFEYKRHFAFAYEKLKELAQLKNLSELVLKENTDLDLALTNLNSALNKKDIYVYNQSLFNGRVNSVNPKVKERLANIKEEDFTRLPEFNERAKIQREILNLPDFPTTTIGSFPQTKEVRENRKLYRQGLINEETYKNFIKEKIKDCIKLQEELDLDVLVHGEFERNDMVEYFGEHLDGYIFTKNAWVQSYGSRCVKPPIIWGDVSRKEAITVDWSSYSNSLTNREVKGMLTGPVTILNWSFPREDITKEEMTNQLALAIRDEVLDLEAAGLKIIQIDEAALREKLPLRKSDWYSEYLDWAIKSFRLVTSGVKPETQIHTHMCYSEFNDIIPAIDAMDADVISFEASRSDLVILDALRKNNFKTAVGPGVYDIHSPRVPSTDEIFNALKKMLSKLDSKKLWVNPDCGLKTRGEKETVESLRNLVAAAKLLRETEGQIAEDGQKSSKVKSA
ncbi:MAG: 5-methyltetrahydropteroyltriglutamate--homocysteine S-methyltransferase [Lachnospira sp.]|nr:5-methyltetrahydropteroyltriglutamate--homocysteine S-methyltransferase [Lachnospira sp.]